MGTTNVVTATAEQVLTALHEGTEEATRPKGPAVDQNRATEIATEIATETATATVTKIATETATEAEPATATATASTGDATETQGTKEPDATRTRPAAHAPSTTAATARATATPTGVTDRNTARAQAELTTDPPQLRTQRCAKDKGATPNTNGTSALTLCAGSARGKVTWPENVRKGGTTLHSTRINSEQCRRSYLSR